MLSIRGARHDRIAAHQLNTFRAKALQVTPQRKPQYATNATQNTCPNQLNHTTQPRWPTSGASRSVFPSFQIARAREQTRPRARADETPRDHFAPTAIKRHRRDAGSPAQEDARRATAPPPLAFPNSEVRTSTRAGQAQWTRGQRPDDVGAQDRRRGLGRPASWERRPAQGNSINYMCRSSQRRVRRRISTLGFFDDDAPWALFAHSMGCWSSYEFALLARSNGKRPPSIMVASSLPLATSL